MEVSIDTLKPILDIGLGAFSLFLWWKQTGINRTQAELDAGQTKGLADITAILRDHEHRLNLLEARKRRPR